MIVPLVIVHGGAARSGKPVALGLMRAPVLARDGAPLSVEAMGGVLALPTDGVICCCFSGSARQLQKKMIQSSVS